MWQMRPAWWREPNLSPDRTIISPIPLKDILILAKGLSCAC